MSDIPLELLSIKQAAEFLGGNISTRTINRHVQAGRLSRIKIGRLTRFALDDLRRFVADCRSTKEGQ